MRTPTFKGGTGAEPEWLAKTTVTANAAMLRIAKKHLETPIITNDNVLFEHAETELYHYMYQYLLQ